MDPRRRDDGKSLIRAMVRRPDGHLIDLDALLRDVAARPLPSELWAEHATVASMATHVRASRDAWVLTPPARRSHRPIVRGAIAAATIVITAGSSLAVTGQLPDAAREFASDAFAMFLPPRERISASSVPMAPTTDQPLDPPEHGAVDPRSFDGDSEDTTDTRDSAEGGRMAEDRRAGEGDAGAASGSGERGIVDEEAGDTDGSEGEIGPEQGGEGPAEDDHTNADESGSGQNDDAGHVNEGEDEATGGGGGGGGGGGNGGGGGGGNGGGSGGGGNGGSGNG
ncbi:MAG: hypothetical protein ACRDG8_09320, partial [Actinomycetota bacterium]